MLAGCDIKIGARSLFGRISACRRGDRTRIGRAWSAGMLVNPLRTGLYEVLDGNHGRRPLELSNEHLQSGEIVADVTASSFRAMQPCHVKRPSKFAAMIDEIPALAVACAFADGESLIEGVE